VFSVRTSILVHCRSFRSPSVPSSALFGQTCLAWGLGLLFGVEFLRTGRVFIPPGVTEEQLAVEFEYVNPEKLCVCVCVCVYVCVWCAWDHGGWAREWVGGYEYVYVCMQVCICVCVHMCAC
jgi:hypothetical protein